MKKRDIELLFETFSKNGYQLYIVGGAVRDFILGEPISDIDFTTDATPSEIEEMFSNTLSVGKKFGTVSVIIDENSYEITTFRSESGYDDKRHPKHVDFSTNLVTDLSRRDFTINALVLDRNGCLIDCFGGLGDLESGVVRTINRPHDRFEEDQLRKWRCIRFAAQKGFEIDKETYESLVFDPDTSMVSIERIREELTKIILTQKVNWGGYLMIRTKLYSRLLERLLPNHSLTGAEVEKLVFPFEVMYFLPEKLSLRLAALALSFEYEEAEALLTGLGYSKKLIRETLSLHRHFSVTVESGEIAYKRVGAEMGISGLENLLVLQKTVAFTRQDRKYERILEETESLLKRIRENNEPLSRGELALNGEDLKELGFEGKEIGVTIENLLEHVYLHPEENNITDLKKFLEL